MRLYLVIALSVLAGIAAPRALAIQANLSGKPSPIWQTNDIVWTLATSNGVVYAGGQFTSVRPPGSAAGTGEVARGRLAAFNASTGELLPLDHTFDNTVTVASNILKVYQATITVLMVSAIGVNKH